MQNAKRTTVVDRVERPVPSGRPARPTRRVSPIRWVLVGAVLALVGVACGRPEGAGSTSRRARVFGQPLEVDLAADRRYDAEVWTVVVALLVALLVLTWFVVRSALESAPPIVLHRQEVIWARRPWVLPAIVNEPATLRVSARCLPVEGRLSGDWFSVLDLPDGRTAITLGDVAGHGAVSAVMARTVEQALATALVAGRPPVEAVESANRLFTGDEIPGRPALASLFVAVVDVEAGRLCYVNAGHPAALLWAPGQRRPVSLAGTGPLLCELMGDGCWTEEGADFPSAATLAVFSDGLIEASPAGRHVEYGYDRLAATLTRLLRATPGRRGGPPSHDHVVARVFDDVLAHAARLTDDSTLVVVQGLSTAAERDGRRPEMG